ncbi:hypothetical protein E2C01_086046 [Portunus trituberculatus]|uniref:Uncharacterized protein n=1 Tax=Portunus trituberculatus TaxID=210409 RepID=A0A5B7JAH5_PORTR|nr:hypothetical protein [Portunus trituberculatus]
MSKTQFCVLNYIRGDSNHAKSFLQLVKHSFINRKCQNLSISNSPRDFWHLAKNIAQAQAESPNASGESEEWTERTYTETIEEIEKKERERKSKLR